MENYGTDEMLMGWLNFPKWYGVYESPEEIDYDTLPSSFVLKTNHASGQVLIVEDKDKLDKKKANKQLKNWLNTSFYEVVVEIHYRDIKPMIICEELLDADITDYRVQCFSGEPYFTKISKLHYRDGKTTKNIVTLMILQRFHLICSVVQLKRLILISRIIGS